MDRWYPNKIMAGSIDDYLPRLSDPACTSSLIQRLEQLFAGSDRHLLKFAEFGVWKGATTGQLAKFLDHKGELHLFDYEDTVTELKNKLAGANFTNITAWGSSYRHLDSYNWNLRLILEHHRNLRFDYIFLDGAHTWAVDALTFMLCDLVLNVGGYIDFDDYGWRLRGSSLDPQRVPVTAELYTDAQIDDFQVKAIVDLLVRSRGTYREIVKNRLFQKTTGTNTVQDQIRNTVAGGRPASHRSMLSVGAPHLFGGEPEMMLRIMRGGHRRYLEFGVGGSTLMATRSGLQSVVAVDSDRHWVDAVRQQPEIDAAIRGGRADIRHADIGPVAQWGYPRDLGHIQSWPTYIATAWDAWSERNEMPDLIFVDGRFRVACCLSAVLVAASCSHSTDDLRVLLHDVGPDRPYYDGVLGFFDVVESVNTLRVMKIKPGISGSRVMSMLLRHQFDLR
jgi:Methyltransferase domain